MSDKINLPSPEEIEAKLREIFGADAEDEQDDDMTPACLGFMVHKAGGHVVITQADLDEINHARLRVAIDGPSETITLTMVYPEAQ